MSRMKVDQDTANHGGCTLGIAFGLLAATWSIPIANQGMNATTIKRAPDRSHPMGMGRLVLREASGAKVPVDETRANRA
jgi:hypothetical protein